MKDRYDVIIIGAGIGGLVCGCYLAKSGAKVLIIEQHDKPGGYCTSFKRKGYAFDVGVHYLGAGRSGGELGNIFNELSIYKRLVLRRIDPCDKVILPEHSFRIRSDHKESIEEIKRAFYYENNAIDDFFNFITTKDFYKLYSICKNITFKELLDQYFSNYKLKSALSVLLGNIGLPASKVAAISAAALYREFILDPGYYPEGGMQAFADALAEIFQEYGGAIVYNERVNKIVTENYRVARVNIEDNSFETRYVVSNADATETFEELLDIECPAAIARLNTMEPSFSAFAVYLGVKLPVENILIDKCSTWYFTTYDIETCYGSPMHNFTSKVPNYVVCIFPSFHNSSEVSKSKFSMILFSAASYMTKVFWENNKKAFADKMINMVASGLIKDLSNNIEVTDIATPHTFNRYTSNYNGALYGWACTVKQINEDSFPQETLIKNLILVGHWCTNGVGQGGISEVIYSGRKASKIIIKQLADRNSILA